MRLLASIGEPAIGYPAALISLSAALAFLGLVLGLLFLTAGILQFSRHGVEGENDNRGPSF